MAAMRFWETEIGFAIVLYRSKETIVGQGSTLCAAIANFDKNYLEAQKQKKNGG